MPLVGGWVGLIRSDDFTVGFTVNFYLRDFGPKTRHIQHIKQIQAVSPFNTIKTARLATERANIARDPKERKAIVRRMLFGAFL